MWIFGYGSLMWDPGFDPAEARSARLHGWHRRFTVESVQSWGRPGAPGLCLALHPGGSTLGLALRVDAARAAEILAYLDEREDAYRRVPVALHLTGGDRVEGLTYVSDPSHPRCAAALDDRTRHAMIRTGVGTKGSSAGYLRETVRWLERQGQRRTSMHRLLRAVEAR